VDVPFARAYKRGAAKSWCPACAPTRSKSLEGVAKALMSCHKVDRAGTQPTIDHNRSRLKHSLRAAWRPAYLTDLFMRALTRT